MSPKLDAGRRTSPQRPPSPAASAFSTPPPFSKRRPIEGAPSTNSRPKCGRARKQSTILSRTPSLGPPPSCLSAPVPNSRIWARVLTRRSATRRANNGGSACGYQARASPHRHSCQPVSVGDRSPNPGDAADGARQVSADPGVDARAALLSGAAPGPVPVPPLPAARPGHPAALPMDPPAWRTGLRDDLLALAADAARRAWELAGGLSPDAGLSLSPDCDLARRAEHALGTPTSAALAANTGVSGPELTRQALAWRYGAAPGLEVLRTEWDPGAEAAGAAELMKAARTALRDAAGAPASVTRNRATAARAHPRNREPVALLASHELTTFAQPPPPCSALELRCGTMFPGKHEGGHRGHKHIVSH
jgi:hypothetical protein